MDVPSLQNAAGRHAAEQVSHGSSPSLTGQRALFWQESCFFPEEPPPTERPVLPGPLCLTASLEYTQRWTGRPAPHQEGTTVQTPTSSAVKLEYQGPLAILTLDQPGSRANTL